MIGKIIMNNLKNMEWVSVYLPLTSAARTKSPTLISEIIFFSPFSIWIISLAAKHDERVVWDVGVVAGKLGENEGGRVGIIVGRSVGEKVLVAAGIAFALINPACEINK